MDHRNRPSSMDTANKRLSGKKVAILVASGFEEIQMTETQKALLSDGAGTTIVSPEIGVVNGWHGDAWGHNFFVETKAGAMLPSQFDGLLLCGGQRNIMGLMNNAHGRRIIKGMVDQGKTVGVVGDGVVMLAMAEVAAGRTISGAPEAREKIEQAGGVWAEAPVSVDGSLVTSAGGEDLGEFVAAFLDSLGAATVTADDATEAEADQAA